MNNLRQAAEQALEALESGLAFDKNSEVLQNLRAALAEPEQEPFCYHDGRNIVGKEYADHSDVFPLYTASPQQQSDPLIEEQRLDIVATALRGHASTRDAIQWAIKAVERHHGIKE